MIGENDSINEQESCEKNFEDKSPNNLVNYKSNNDTNFDLKANNVTLKKELNDSQENENTSISIFKEYDSQDNENASFSKDSREIKDNENSHLNKISNDSFIFIGENKIFKNLQIESFSIKLAKKEKENNKIQKKIELAISPKEEDYDESTKFDFLLKIKPKGLLNLGGCCYMNATLQCFYHIKELTYYFLDNKKEIKRKKGILSLGYLDMVEGLSKLDREKYYIPRKFKNSLIETDDSFEGSGGKDSGDLIELFLYTIQQELGGDSDFPDLSIDQRNERLIYLDLYYKNSKVNSIITELFNFEIKNTSKCLWCGLPFYNISSENSLLFSLERVYNFSKNSEKNNEENNNKIFNSFKNNRRVSVDECLTCFSLDGSLRENEVCKYCNKNSSILTTRGFLTLPKILIMIMSRGEREKFECDVDFKEEIDLVDLYINMKGITQETSTKYSLLGGTILYGSHGSGHTVAFCKHFDGEYYIFNDSSARKANFNEIKNSKIYLLFYQKIN